LSDILEENVDQKYFTFNDNGLNQDWSNEIVFMNPPYGGNTGDWIRKAYAESIGGATVVCLIVSSTDRSYWHDYIFPYAHQIRFLRGRLKFSNSISTAPFASAIVLFADKRRTNDYIVFYNESVSSLKKRTATAQLEAFT